MEQRFQSVQGTAVFLSIVFGVFLVGGIVLLVVNDPEASSNLFGAMERGAQIALGGTLVIGGLLGLLISGAVRVLIAIEENTRVATRAVREQTLADANRVARAEAGLS